MIHRFKYRVSYSGSLCEWEKYDMLSFVVHRGQYKVAYFNSDTLLRDLFRWLATEGRDQMKWIKIGIRSGGWLYSQSGQPSVKNSKGNSYLSFANDFADCIYDILLMDLDQLKVNILSGAPVVKVRPTWLSQETGIIPLDIVSLLGFLELKKKVKILKKTRHKVYLLLAV